MNSSNIIQITRDIFLKNKNKLINISNESIDKINDISTLLNANSNTEENNWREYKSQFKPKTTDKETLTKNEINSFLNKLSIKNFSNISQKILELSKENNNSNMLDYLVDNIFSKAVFQPIYCQYYVKLLFIFIENSFNILEIITNKCNKYSDLTFNSGKNYENYENLDSTAQEKYDLFCKKVKDKTYKVGYSQFIGELYNNCIIEESIILKNINTQFDNLEVLLSDDSDIELIENNIICLCQLIETTLKKFQFNNFSFDNIKSKLNELEPKITLKRLRFKIKDILDSM